MRNIILFNMVTLDGFFADANRQIDWHRVDEEFNDFAIDQLNTAGGLIFGRITYELMASYWPTAAGIEDDPVVAEKMNALPKIVASRTLQTAAWNNTRLVKTNAVEEIAQLKQQAGGNLFVFGSANLSRGLIHRGVIDEFRLMVVPLVLGSGIPLFQDILQPLQLNLVQTRTFRNGNLLLTYQPGSKEG